MRIVVGIGGGIAAYKATVLLRLFSKAGHDVVAMPTEAALEFVGKPTFEALSGNPVSSSVFERVPQVNHVRQAEEADAVVIAPATADLMARLAQGRADDLLSATVLTTHAPVILAPAMHTQMWEHPATVRNVATLRDFGYHVIEPAVGRLTGPDSGVGRLPEPEDIFEEAMAYLGLESASQGASDPKPLAGRRVVVTAGGTREPLDPVRFLGNRSSGKQGIAIADQALQLGADVLLIHGHIEVEVPAHLATVSISTADELRDAVLEHSAGADLLVMAAAVADFKPADYAEYKIKKTENSDDAPVIRLVRNPDILKETVVRRQQNPELGPTLIAGFAAETGSAEHTVLELGQQKLQRKGCDFLAVNTVGLNQGFGAEENALTVLSLDGEQPFETSGSKAQVSRDLLLHIAKHFDEK